MAGVVITPRDWERYIARLGKQYIPAAKRGILSGALHSIPIMHRRTQEAPPANPNGKGTGGAVNYRNYLRSWKAERIDNGATIYNEAPYAGIIEDGRRPGAKAPPREAIARWVQRKLRVTAKEAKSVAFVIARSIKARGLLPRRVMANAIPELTKAILDDVDRELKKVLERVR